VDRSDPLLKGSFIDDVAVDFSQGNLITRPCADVLYTGQSKQKDNEGDKEKQFSH
jgi:hypothetical protein